MGSEKNYENKVKNYLEEQGAWFVKFFANAYTKKGIPDVLACVNGSFFGIEVKAARGKPSELQLYNLRKIDEAGGFGILLYPKDFELFKELVKAVKEHQVEVIMDVYDEQLKRRWCEYAG